MLNSDTGKVLFMAIERNSKLAEQAWIEILIQQYRRRQTLDKALPAVPPEVTRRSVISLLKERNEEPIVGLVNGIPYACALPGLEVRNSEDDELAYFEPRTGLALGLSLRDDSADAIKALKNVLAGLSDWWRRSGATGIRLVWPTAEIPIDHILGRFDIIIDAYVEYLATNKLALGEPGNRFDRMKEVSVRKASTSDLEAALDIHLAVVDAHIPSSPFARRVPGLAPRFEERLRQASSPQGDPLSGDSLIFVAEDNGCVVGLSECRISPSSYNLDSTSWPGRLGYIHSFGVLSDWRGKGIGHLLAQFSIAEMMKLGISGVYLLASHYNEGSVAFWEGFGFRRLWSMYQSRYLGTVSDNLENESLTMCLCRP
jgi:ribosomal protein S18 acetylase RimI-like enzyme